jgi:hypothetical protein
LYTALQLELGEFWLASRANGLRALLDEINDRFGIPMWSWRRMLSFDLVGVLQDPEGSEW